MAVTIHTERPMGYREYYGLSTDDKPTEGVTVNSLFFELDTGNFNYFDGSDWAKVGGGDEPSGDGGGGDVMII